MPMKLFDQVAIRPPKKNKFDLSHERKMTMNMGPLYPVLYQEHVPGDSFRVQSDVFLRFLALIAPVMHRVDVYVHFFDVPWRLVWKNWEDFITGGRDGLAAPVFPTMTVLAINNQSPTYLRTGSLLDYMGWPVMKTASSVNAGYNSDIVTALGLRAYQLIYDEYYRDQNVEVSVRTANFMNDGPITGTEIDAILQIRKRAWEKDYQTSCLPWAQRGGEVSVPITSTITAVTGGSGGNDAKIRRSDTGAIMGNMETTATANPTTLAVDTGGIAGLNAYYDPNGTLVANSSNLTINALRLSIRLQEWLEKNARGGARYIEQILAHFGVVSSDARLNRPEYLGGGKQPVVISEVLQMAPQAAGTPLATMAGHGISVGTSNRFKKFFEEHGCVIGLISVLPKTSYQQYLPKHWFKTTNTEMYFPEFAHLGEQAVLNKEIYYDVSDGPSNAGRNNTFGYNSRYSDLKYGCNTVHGQFREAGFQTWHLGRIFTAQPNLNTTFIQSNPRTDIFAVTADVDHLVCQVFHKIDALRPMPYFGTPTL